MVISDLVMGGGMHTCKVNLCIQDECVSLLDDNLGKIVLFCRKNNFTYKNVTNIKKLTIKKKLMQAKYVNKL